MRSGSTSVRRSTREPAIASTRLRIAAVSSAVSGTALVTVAMTTPRWALSWRLYSSLTRGRACTLPRSTRRVTSRRAPAEIRGSSSWRTISTRCDERDRGAVHGRLDVGPAEHLRRGGEVRLPAVELVLREGHLEGGLRVAPGGGDGPGSSVVRPAGRGLGQEVGDELALAVGGHRLTDHAPGGGEGEVGDLPAQLGDGPLLLRLDLGGGALLHPGELLAGGRDVLLARLGRDLLGAVDDLVRLAAGLLQGGEPLLLGGLAVATGLLGVLEPLLDPLAALVERLLQTRERELADQEEEQDEGRRARR